MTELSPPEQCNCSRIQACRLGGLRESTRRSGVFAGPLDFETQAVLRTQPRDAILQFKSKQLTVFSLVCALCAFVVSERFAVGDSDSMSLKLASSRPSDVRSDDADRNDFRTCAFGEHGHSSIDRLKVLAIPALPFGENEDRFAILQRGDCEADRLGVALPALYWKRPHASDEFPKKFVAEELFFRHETQRTIRRASYRRWIEVAHVIGCNDDRALTWHILSAFALY